MREKSVREKNKSEKNMKREKHNAHNTHARESVTGAHTPHDTGDHKKDAHKKSKSKNNVVITIDDKEI